MKFLKIVGVIAALGLAAGCGPALDELSNDDLDQIELAALDSKDDSARRPTYMGLLEIGTPETHWLTGRAGFHLYAFEGRAGLKLKLVHKSGHFRTYLRVISSSGRRWSVPGVRNPDNGAWYSVLELELPTAGHYYVLATSYRNMLYGAPLSRGEYTLSADSMDPCEGRPVSSCTEDPRCEVVGIGCENHTCDPEAGTCHPCDPLPVCRQRRAGGEGAACGSWRLAPCAEGLFCSYAPEATCGWADAAGTCQRRPQACITLYDPVCGCDGRTYSNSCAAASNGVSVQYRGACR